MKWGLLFGLLYIIVSAQRAWPFYPGNEKAIRTEPFEKRKIHVPIGWETPAWKALAYQSDDAKAVVIFDRHFTAQADQNRRDIFRELDRKLIGDRHEEFVKETRKWVTIFQYLRGKMHDGLKAKNLPISSTKQIIVPKFSMAVPAIPDKLYKSMTFLEGVGCLTHLPRDIAMAITIPTTFAEYIALRGFLSLIPEFAPSLPDDYPFRIVVHHELSYRQWGNRWTAANFTSSQSEWVSFWDNDDFPSPARYRWYDKIFTAHPELDVFLGGKWFMRPGSWDEVVKITSKWSQISDDPRVAEGKEKGLSDTEIEDKLLTEALGYDIEEGYNEPMRTMNTTWLAKWRVGSIIGAPLWTGHKHFIQSLYNATYDALNHTDKYTEEQLNLIKEELDFLHAVEKKEEGLGWGDKYAQDGWSTIRREVLNLINPPTRVNYGEDCLYNWMIAASGLNYFHMVQPFFHLRTGIYYRWPKQDVFWKLPPDSSAEK